MSDFKKMFGANVKKIRNKRNFTQFELAEKLGIDEKHLSHIETGRSFPKANLIEKMIQCFEIDFSTLFNFSEEKNREEILLKIQKMIDNLSDNDLYNIYKMIEIYIGK